MRLTHVIKNTKLYSLNEYEIIKTVLNFIKIVSSRVNKNLRVLDRNKCLKILQRLIKK